MTGKRTGVENDKFIHFNLSRVLIQLTILMQKSRWQYYDKDKTGNLLKLKA